MGAIFLSYAREDRASAQNLARVLESAGHSVWWDRHLDGGEEFSAEIEAALGQSDVVVVAWSKESVKSRWVRDEAAVGGDTGKLVPVTMDGSLPPMGFRQFHTLDLSDWNGARRDERTADLLHSVDRRLKGKDKVAATAPTVERKPRLGLPRGKRLWALAAVLLLVIGAGMAVVLFNRGTSPRGPPPRPTIALLPFTTASADVQLREIAAQSRDSVSHTLAQTGIPVRLLNSVPQDRQSAGDFLLSGELTRNADKVVAIVHLDEAAHGVTVYSQRFEAVGGDVGNLADRIGAQMASLFDGANLMVLDRRHPMDPALMAELLGTFGDPLQKYQIAKRVAAKAPDHPMAQLGVAFFTGFVLADLPQDERPQAVAEARRASEYALKLAPEFGDSYVPWCLLHSETRVLECEDRMRMGNRIDPDAPYLRGFLAAHMRNVGRFDEAVELTRLSYAHDPYDVFKIRDMLRTFELSGDSDDARQLFQQGARWWPDFRQSFFRQRLFGLIDRGAFEAIAQLEHDVNVHDFAEYHDSTALVAAVKHHSIAAARRACPESADFFLQVRCMIALASLSDEDGAYAIADKLYPRRVGRTPGETERLWLDDPDGPAPTEFIASPAAAPMRRDPRYLALAERTGLLAYWRSGRPPDFCRKQPEPICSQLLHSR